MGNSDIKRGNDYANFSKAFSFADHFLKIKVPLDPAFKLAIFLLLQNAKTSEEFDQIISSIERTTIPSLSSINQNVFKNKEFIDFMHNYYANQSNFPNLQTLANP